MDFVRVSIWIRNLAGFLGLFAPGLGIGEYALGK